jgi:hypothetical protein
MHFELLRLCFDATWVNAPCTAVYPDCRRPILLAFPLKKGRRAGILHGRASLESKDFMMAKMMRLDN